MVVRKARFFTMNSLCQTCETPRKLTRVSLPLRPGQFGQRTFRVTCLKQSTLISYPGIAQEPVEPDWLPFRNAFGILCSVLLGLRWIVSSGISLVTWSLSTMTSPKRSANPQICPVGDTNKIQLEVIHSKQMRYTFTQKPELPQSHFSLTRSRWQKRGQTDLEGETSFFGSVTMATPNPLSPRHLPTGFAPAS